MPREPRSRLRDQDDDRSSRPLDARRPSRFDRSTRDDSQRQSSNREGRLDSSTRDKYQRSDRRRDRERSRSPPNRRRDPSSARTRRDRDPKSANRDARVQLDPDADGIEQSSGPSTTKPVVPVIAPVKSLPRPQREHHNLSAETSPDPRALSPEREIEMGEEEEDEDNMMQRMMGFSALTSSKGKHVTGNEERGAADIVKPRTWRQYMNRRGGFNRPLDKVT